MSDSHLPDDLAAWPRDPYQLLGIARGTPAREAKHAYRALIRRYKPEQAPEAFRLIRDAWEAVERMSLTETELEIEFDDESELLVFEPAVPTPVAPDLWDQMMAGSISVDETYQALTDRVERGSRAEDDFLQLAWLLTNFPRLDPTNGPGGWLIVGFLTCGPTAVRLGEWLRRQTDADPEWAVAAPFGVLLARPMPIAATTWVVAGRWRAARRLGRWDQIQADIATLREWVPEVAVEGWPALLILAAENLTWINDPARILRVAYLEEAEEVAHNHALDLDDALARYEYADGVAGGLYELAWEQVANGRLPPLLRDHWDSPGPGRRQALQQFAPWLADWPKNGLRQLDKGFKVAPAVLGLLWDFLGGHRSLAPADPTTVHAVGRFVLGRAIFPYSRFRLKLLDYCLAERISPEVVARALEDRTELTLTNGLHLGLTIGRDWPLLTVYRLVELTRD